jgi:hypothetical protein
VGGGKVVQLDKLVVQVLVSLSLFIEDSRVVDG